MAAAFSSASGESDVVAFAAARVFAEFVEPENHADEGQRANE